ncbi:MAG: glucose 1-dehydrogenase [Acidobacteriota bacterium]
MQLENKLAIVTGGARGIGAGIARCLSEAGARVAVVDIDGAAAGKTAADLGTEALGLAADVGRVDEIASVMERVVGEWGGIDILINNAGAGTGREKRADVGSGFESLSETSWDEQVTNNLRTTYAASRAAIAHLRARGGGSIVNIASIAALTPSPALPAYGAAKAGVVHLTRTLALELAPSDIRVNVICPGFLWTRAWEGLATGLKATVPQLADKEPREIFLGSVKRDVPLGREQTPEDIGRLVVFLTSDGARNITGQEIAVDGGITLRGTPH